MTNKAIAYLRASTDMQDASIPEQKKSIDEFAKKHDLYVIRYFEDEGRSGRNAEERPAFMEMKGFVENSNNFRFILVYDCTRFGRFKDPQEAVYWEVSFKKCGKIIKYATDESANDNTIGGRLIKTLKHEQATQYALDLSKTAFRGHKHYAALGFHVGGVAKYGYKRALFDESGKLVNILEYGEHKALKTQHVRLVKGDPDQVRTVQRIYNMYVNDELGINTITSVLNKEGIPSPVRRPKAMSRGWSKTTVWSILHDPTYMGWVVYNKNAYDNLLEQDKGWGRTKPESEWIINKTAHEPIVSEELFRAVSVRMKSPARKFSSKGNSSRNSPYLLAGLIKCHSCKATYQGRCTPHYAEKKTYNTRYYVCGSYVMRGKEVCKSYCVDAKALEGIVVNRMRNITSNPQDINKMEQDLKKRLEAFIGGGFGKTEDISKELNEVNAQIANLIEGMAKVRDTGAIAEKINELSAKRDRLLNIKDDRPAPVDIGRYTNRVRQFMGKFNEKLEDVPVTVKKEMFKECLNDIMVDSTDERCYFRFKKADAMAEDIAKKLHMVGSRRTLTTNLTDIVHNFRDINELCDVEILDFNKKPLMLVPIKNPFCVMQKEVYNE